MSRKQKKKDAREQSTRQLMGIDDITDYGIATRMGELVFFAIKPTNISVLPDAGVGARIYALLNVVKGMPLGDDLGGSYPAAREKVPEPAKPFTLPAQSESMRRVYAYLLQKRCIDREILNAFVRKKLIYESCERSRDGTKEYHNAVFVGFDEHGVPRHGHKRGLYTMGQGYRGNIEGSDPRHSFHYLGGDDTLYVFEAPIDLLSYISLFPEGWQEHNYVACCGTSSIPVLEMLRQLPQLRQVYLCLDNDAAGHAASERMAKLLEERGISAERLVPQQKDWNDDLKAEQENKMERSELCQTFC